MLGRFNSPTGADGTFDTRFMIHELSQAKGVDGEDRPWAIWLVLDDLPKIGGRNGLKINVLNGLLKGSSLFELNKKLDKLAKVLAANCDKDFIGSSEKGEKRKLRLTVLIEPPYTKSCYNQVKWWPLKYFWREPLLNDDDGLRQRK